MEEKLDRSINKDINEHCGTCASACCGPEINIVLSNAEKDFLRSAGTVLLLINPIGNTNMKLYSLESKCGYVENKDGLYQCSVHNNPQRPVVCGELKAGGELCRQIKESRKAGVGYEFGY